MSGNRVEEIIACYDNVISWNLKFQSALAYYRDIAQDEDSIAYDKIPDVLLFASMLQIDLAVCNKHLLIYKEKSQDYEMKYFARALVLHLYDLIDTNGSNKFLNRVNEICKDYKTNSATQNFALTIISARKKIIDLGKKNQSALKTVRNNLLVHRNGAGIDQYDEVPKVDVERIALLGADIEEDLDIILKHLLEIQKVLYPPIPNLSP